MPFAKRTGSEFDNRKCRITKRILRGSSPYADRRRDLLLYSVPRRRLVDLILQMLPN